ncbi:glycoside hydrolase family 6 protein [Gordonia caeni]|uniref:Glucanase n=1 Tax=Gordonia caeni TaxID=1007097 RepID=A0ABP7NS55_9ACTN
MTGAKVTNVVDVTRAARRRRRAAGALAAAVLVGAPLGAGHAAALPELPLPGFAVPQLSEDGGNSSLGGTPSVPDIPLPGTDTSYLVGARPSYYANLQRMAAAAPDPVKKAINDLAAVPVAQWVGGDGLNDITRLVTEGKAKNATPVAVLYHVPHRDLGNHSGGGAATAAAYKQWIDSVSSRIGSDRMVVILEPDALPQMSELTAAQATERAQLLAYALQKLGGNANATVYLDAGTAGWRTVAQTAADLKKVAANGATIDGISLNVSNFKSKATTVDYADQIAGAYGKPLKVMVDNSRNGAAQVPEGWCNPDGQRLGTLADNVFDAQAKVEEMFIKTPGESDGVCGVSSKAAGVFDDALLMLQLGLASAAR